jgi:hypothetical protein
MRLYSVELFRMACQLKGELRMEKDRSSSNASLMNRCEYSSTSVQCDKPVIQSSHFCAEHTNQPSVDLEVYKSLHARFHHYVDTSWTRTNFFFLVQAGFFTVFTGVLASKANQASRYLTPIDFIIGFVGLAIACLWYKSSKLNLKFMKLWRGQVIKIDKAVDRRQHHAEIEEQLQTSLTGTELTQWLCIVFIAGWFLLLGALLWLTLAH